MIHKFYICTAPRLVIGRESDRGSEKWRVAGGRHNDRIRASECGSPVGDIWPFGKAGGRQLHAWIAPIEEGAYSRAGVSTEFPSAALLCGPAAAASVAAFLAAI